MELAMQQEKAKQLRAEITKMTYPRNPAIRAARCLCVEMLMALYYNMMKVDPSNPGLGTERDRFVLSKGHALPGAVCRSGGQGVSSRGRNSWTLRRAAQPSAGPSRYAQDARVWTRNTGSLGQGVSIAGGIGAWPPKYKGKSHRVFAIMRRRRDAGGPWCGRPP